MRITKAQMAEAAARLDSEAGGQMDAGRAERWYMRQPKSTAERRLRQAAEIVRRHGDGLTCCRPGMAGADPREHNRAMALRPILPAWALELEEPGPRLPL